MIMVYTYINIINISKILKYNIMNINILSSYKYLFGITHRLGVSTYS